MNRRPLYLLIALFVPLSIFVPWIVCDHTYPISDASDLIKQAYRIYLAWKKQGWLAGLPALYLARMSKPVLYPPLGALALAITGGDVLWAVRLVYVAFYGLFLVFADLALGLFLPAAEAALGAALVGLLPWCFANAHSFSMEIPGLCCNVAALYWLVRARRLERVRDAAGFGVCLGLGLCFRPADVAVFYTVPLLIWIGTNWRDGRLRPRDVVAWAAAGAPLLALVALSPQPSPWAGGLVVALALPVALIALAAKVGLNRAFAWAAFLGVLVPALWFAPFAGVLYAWLHDSAYGPIALKTAAETAEPFVLRFALYICGLPFAVVAVAAWLGRGGLAKSGARPAWVAAVVAFPLLIEAVTYAPSIRYYYASGFVLFAGALVLALGRGGARRRLRVGLVVAAASLCWLCDLETLVAPHSAWRLLPHSPRLEFYLVEPSERDSGLWTVETLAKVLPPGHQNVIVLVAANGDQQDTRVSLNDSGELWVSDISLSVMAWERGLDWEFLSEADQLGQADDIAIMISRRNREATLRWATTHHPEWRLLSEGPMDTQVFDGVCLVFGKS